MDARMHGRWIGSLLALVALLCPATASAATPSAPVKVSPPTLAGSSAAAGYARVGDTLTCAPGAWSGTGITYSYKWTYSWEAGTPADPTGPTRSVRPEDLGHRLACEVTVTNAGGSRRASVAVA